MIHTEDNIEYLCGTKEILNKPVNVFSDEVCHFLNDISSALFKSSQLRTYSDLSALAFWCRKSHIQQLKANYDDIESRMGRGLCFHIAPSNIPINFAFSFVFSLLAGNANIVRVPSKPFPQVAFLCEILECILNDHPEIKQRTSFIRYSKDSVWTAYFSTLADCRMIWGGDETVSKIKRLETKPNCIDISFADRYSICILNGDAILLASENEISQIAHNFYNDTYLMDQNACSSPQLICWFNDSKEARRKFWDTVYNLVKTKYPLTNSMVVDKYAKLFNDFITLPCVKESYFQSNSIYHVELAEINQNTHQLRGQCGYFYEYSLSTFDDIVMIINEKFQTLTYYGIDILELKSKIMSQNVKGIDRIVPIGKALDIDIVWDGHDLLRELSRKLIIL